MEIALFKKVIVGDNYKFNTFVARYGKTNKYIDVRITKDVLPQIDINNFPYKVELDPEDYFLTIKKDKRGKPILNKAGETIPVLVLKSLNKTTLEHCEYQGKTLEDLDR